MIIFGVTFPQRNSFNGDKVEMTWLDSPLTATDTIRYGPDTTYAYTANKINGNRDVIFDLSMKDGSGNRIIKPNQIFYIKITGTASGYNTGLWTGSTYATIFNPSKGYEAYDITSSYDSCGARVQWTFFAENPGNLAYDPSKTGDPNSKQTTNLYVHFDSHGAAGCWPYTIAARDLSIDVYAIDSAGVVDWITAKDLWIYSGYAGGSGSISYGVSVGFDGGNQVYRGGLSFSATYTPTNTASFPKHVVNQDQGGGTKYFGNYGVNWPTQTYASLDAVMPVFVFDQKAAARLYDKVTFAFRVTVYYDTFLGGWYGNQGKYDQIYFILGDGNINYANIADVFTSVQSGWMQGVE